MRAHTAETVVVPLSDAELEMVKKLHAAWHMGFSHSVPQDMLALCERLEERVQRAVWGGGAGGGGAAPYFVKTSMRSPKDAVKVEHAPDDPPHVRLRNEVAACAVRSASAAIELCTASRRVVTDISYYQRYRIPGIPLNLVLRKWDSDVAGGVEWRCFIADGRLTAISQYHCYTALPEITSPTGHGETVRTNLAKLRGCLVAFQRRVHTDVVRCIGAASYVLDLATQRSARCEGFEVRLVEVNPIHMSGAALFSWKADRPTLLGRPGGARRADGLVELRVVGAVVGRV